MNSKSLNKSNIVQMWSPLEAVCRACRSKRFSVVILLFLASITLQAQENENLGTEVVNIVKPYSPTLSDAFKIKETPVINDSLNTDKKEVKYTIFSVPVASTFTPAKGKATAVEKAKNTHLYDNYATLGAGNYLNVLAELYSNFEISRTDNFGIYFKHNSSQGGIDGLRLDDKFYDTKLEGNYSSRQKDMSYGIKAGVEHQIYNWYGLSSFYAGASDEVINSIDSKHSYFSGFAEGLLEMEDSYFEKATASIRYLGDNFSSSEFNIKANPEFGFDVLDFPVNIGVDLDYLNGKFDRDYSNTSELKYSFFNLGLAPSVDYLTEDLSVSVGFEAVVSMDPENSDTNFYIYPNVEVSYRLVDEILIAYGGVDGGLQQNTYYDFKDENPFVSPTLLITPTHQQYYGFAGLKGKLTNTLAYNVKASYSNEKDKALYTVNHEKQLDQALEGYEYGNSFYVVYADVSTLSVLGELNLELSKNFSLGINGTYNNFDMSKQPEPWNLPTIEASVFSSFNISEKFYGGASLFFVGERKDFFISENEPFPFGDLFSELIILDSYIDANAHLGYRFNQQLSFFIKGSNLLGDNYQKWTNYPVQGIQILGGASYKFDW
ncbi:MAG: TonB-dependent receptor [Flavobacteriaceae bacterium]|nr:TonB-dependent receptor [Flavobacteriaceae bacterium]